MTVRESPNIWQHTEIYEAENAAADPDGRLIAALRAVGDWSGRDVLELGCGTGFHLPELAGSARNVWAVEPHPPLAALARRRTRRLTNVTVSVGTAEATGLADACVDVVIARWVWATESPAAVAELARVLRPGGTVMIVDNDPSRSTFGAWFAEAYPDRAASRFWAERGWASVPVQMGWRFESVEDFASVVRIEFPPRVADRILASYPGGTGPVEVDYAVRIWWRPAEDLVRH